MALPQGKDRIEPKLVVVNECVGTWREGTMRWGAQYGRKYQYPYIAGENPHTSHEISLLWMM